MKYQCPECKRSVTTNSGIVLIGERERTRSLFVFDPRLGSYEHEVADDIDVPPGSIWEFYCPVCGADLTSKHSGRLARLEMMVGDTTRRVVFSKIASEHATFVLGGEDLEKHGDQADAYLERDE
ncbi:MAG: hypothetical protein R6V85_12030 [Polyangia bacterium]